MGGLGLLSPWSTSAAGKAAEKGSAEQRRDGGGESSRNLSRPGRSLVGSDTYEEPSELMLFMLPSVDSLDGCLTKRAWVGVGTTS